MILGCLEPFSARPNNYQLNLVPDKVQNDNYTIVQMTQQFYSRSPWQQT